MLHLTDEHIKRHLSYLFLEQINQKQINHLANMTKQINKQTNK